MTAPELKRYDLFATGPDYDAFFSDIVETPEGKYVRFADVEAYTQAAIARAEKAEALQIWSVLTATLLKEKGMTEIEQAIASLKYLVECRCDEAYTGRGRHDPHSACDYAEEMKIVADHVALIEAKLATCEKYRDAYAECDRIGTQAVRDLEAKLDKAVAALQLFKDFDDLPLSAKRPDVFERKVRHPILVALAEIKG